MDIRNLETFLRVVELGNFTRAAAEQGYVQSTVTAQIQQMETELGFPLFDRVGKKVSLTSGGQQLIPYAREAVSIMEQIAALDQRTAGTRCTLRIGVLESLMFSAMLDILPAYQEQYKNVEIRIRTGASAELIEQLKKNQLDLIYISEIENVDPELSSCCRHKESMVFVANSGHALAGRGLVSLQEIFSHPMIVTEKSGIIYRTLKELAAANHCTLHASVMVNSVNAIIEMLMRSEGLAFLPEYAVAGYLSDGRIALVNADIPGQTYYSQVLYYKGKWIPPYMQAMIEEIQAYAQHQKNKPAAAS
ncbi:MAG: LysR family transcriptional regulator [Eubacterium sp.]|nr:LysR family transcriptional regulator [Eubacterium sp.]